MVRQLLKKQSDRVFHVCYSDKYFVNSSSLLTNILFENRKRKGFEILEHDMYTDYTCSKISNTILCSTLTKVCCPICL